MHRSGTRAARTGFGITALLAVCAAACGRGGPEVTLGGDFGDASYADVVVDVESRPEWRSLREPPRGEADEPSASPDAAVDGGDAGPPIPEVGAVEILIGTEGDRRELPAEAIDRFDGGFSGVFVRAGETPPRRLHVVLDAPYQSWADEGTFVHLVVLTPELRPAAGAEIYLFGRLIGIADEHGAFAFRRAPTPGGMDGGQGLIVARHEGLTRRVRYDAGARTSSFEAVTIYAYTDRGIYEPGDTALMRAVAWRLRGEYVPLAGRPLEIELVADDERIVSGAVASTDDWGVAELALPIPATLTDGPYRLRVRSGEETAESRLVVQHFVAPVIEMDHDLPRYLARTREELAARVSLRYFAGGVFEAGHLALVAKQGETELARVERDVTGPGPHELRFDASTLAGIVRALGGTARDARRTLALDLTASDASGRTDTIHRFVDVVPNPYLVAVELDRTRYQVGDPVNVMVRATERDGVPVRDRAVSLAIGTTQRLTATTDASGVARFTFPMIGTSAPLRAYLDDVREPVGEAELPSPVRIPMLSAVPSTVVPSGTAIDVRVVFPSDVLPVETVVHADVVDSSGAIIHSSLVPISQVGGRPEARSTVTASSWGSMLLTLWCVARRGDAVGVVTDGQSLVVTPGETLTVTLGGLPEQAGPGDEIEASVEVRNARGELSDAVLGVSLSDRAVLSLLDPFERAPVDRFYNPERKVLASTGAQTLTWPWVSRTWGEDRVDIGWPGTFGFHAGRESPPSVVEPSQLETFDALPLYGGGGMWALGALMGDQIGANFGFGGLGLIGTGMGGGGTGEGTIGLGNLGTIGHGAGTGTGSGYGSGAGRLGGRDDGDEQPPAAQPTTIVLRTNHDETSLWLPRLVAEGGRATVRARLPDSITEEELNVLATDRAGGVALARIRVPIAQEVFARSDFPAQLTEGEVVHVTVAAENHGAAARDVTVVLEALPQTAASPGELQVVGQPVTARVAPGGTVTADFRVTVDRPGRARYAVRATAGELEDIDERDVFIAPAGAPEIEPRVGMLDTRGVYRTSLELDGADHHREIRLGVTFPTVAPAIAGLETLYSEGTWGPDPASSQVMGAAALYRYLVLSDRFEPNRDAALVGRLHEAAARLTHAQGFDGGFGWYWSEGASAPFITVHVLEAMLELRDVGFFEDDLAIRRAAAYLVSTLREHGPLAASEVAPWEGSDPWISISATVEALHAIARALPEHDSLFAIVRDELAPPRIREVLDAPDPSPLALAHAVAAGMWLGILDRDDVRAAVPRLAEIRDITHWEPGWFDAWGGTVEAAATTLEVLDALRTSQDDAFVGFVPHATFESAARDAIRFILHTRGSFGAWHNTRATAWAIRALTRVPPGDPEDHGTLRVLVDGEERHAIEVSASDLFASALRLRELDLSGLDHGRHEVEVRYDGRSRPRVELEVRRWRGSGRVEAPPEAARLDVQRSGTCEAMEIDECVVVTLPAELRFPALVEQPIGATVEVDRRELELLRSRGTVAWYEVSGGVLRVVVPTRAPALRLPLLHSHSGRSLLPPARAPAPARGTTWTSQSAELAIP